MHQWMISPLFPLDIQNAEERFVLADALFFSWCCCLVIVPDDKLIIVFCLPHSHPCPYGLSLSLLEILVLIEKCVKSQSIQLNCSSQFTLPNMVMRHIKGAAVP
jgi:hypothetical protein